MITPIYFGDPPRQLFAIHETPSDGESERGTLLCYPDSHEYVGAHRTFRVLSKRLAAAGHHVLRFDYSGTGDSWGNLADVSVEDWRTDIERAVTFLHLNAKCRSISIVGLRLGATLAALTSDARTVEHLVLWQPVTNGREYLRTVIQNHQNWLAIETRQRRGVSEIARDDEALGYQLTATMQAGIADIDLIKVEQAPARRVTILIEEKELGLLKLQQRLAALGCLTESVKVTGPRVWQAAPGMESGVVPTSILQDILSLLN